MNNVFLTQPFLSYDVRYLACLRLWFYKAQLRGELRRNFYLSIPRLVAYASSCTFDFVVKTFTLKGSSRSLSSRQHGLCHLSLYLPPRYIQAAIYNDDFIIDTSFHRIIVTKICKRGLLWSQWNLQKSSRLPLIPAISSTMSWGLFSAIRESFQANRTK